MHPGTTPRVTALLIIHAALLSACADKVIGAGQNIHHDDFEYIVKSVETADRIGDKTARGVFYIVTFVVENRARRVDHGWKSDIAYVVDATGQEYENDRDAQQALAAVTPFNADSPRLTAPGENDSTKFVFDLPKDVKEPCLKVRGDFLMGDLFDGNQYKRTRVKLF
jgi:predicted small secreted protein